MTEEKDTTYSSIWFYRRKNTLWKGTLDPIANLHGIKNTRGKNYSEFNPLVAENIINFWSEPNDIILDPFAGRTRGMISCLKKRNYIGFEISKQVHDKVIETLNKNKLLEYEYKINIINDDSFNIDEHNIEQVDFIFTCPPYWNIEKYESCNGQLSDINNYDLFLYRYKQIMKKSIEHLKENKFMAIVVGDFRIDKKYYTFHIDNIKIMEELGMKLQDLVIIQSVTLDVAARRFGFLKNYKMTSKIHEYLLVFKKEKQK